MTCWGVPATKYGVIPWSEHVKQANEILNCASEALSLTLSRYSTIQIKQKSEALVMEELKFLAKANLSIKSTAAEFGNELSNPVNHAIEALNNYTGLTGSGSVKERLTHQKDSKEYLQSTLNAIGNIKIKERI